MIYDLVREEPISELPQVELGEGDLASFECCSHSAPAKLVPKPTGT